MFCSKLGKQGRTPLTSIYGSVLDLNVTCSKDEITVAANLSDCLTVYSSGAE